MGYASVWLAIASILATFDISKARDPITDEEIEVLGTTISGLVRLRCFFCGFVYI